jgi:hypothetical protein
MMAAYGSTIRLFDYQTIQLSNYMAEGAGFEPATGVLKPL